MPHTPLVVVDHAVELSDTFARYRRALAQNRPGQRPTLAVTEEVLASRVALYDALVSDGWDAPDQVTQQVERDRLVLNVPATG